MRGDSLRDFYAKTLALTGLGTLALIGAFVDSWPGPLELASATGPAGSRAQLAVLAPKPVPSVLEPIAVREVPSAPRKTMPAQLSLPVAVADPVRVAALAPAVSELSVVDDIAPAVELTAEAPQEPALFVMAASYLPGVEVALAEPVQVAASFSEGPVLSPAPVASAASGDDDDGLIAGAFKRTGSSILKGGAKTGASVLDAFRIVSGAVRKALP